MGECEESAANDDFVKQSTPAPITTIAVPPAARTQELTPAQAKKIKDREYQRRKRANMSHRSTGESDDEPVSSVSSRRPTKRARLGADDD